MISPKSILTILLFFILYPILLAGQDPDPETCRQLANLSIEDTNLLSATVIEASDDLPEYCRILGYVRPAINFEIRLPTENWNSKFYMAGCGGFCGKIGADKPGFFNSGIYGLKRNYAVSKMDGGHWDESWLDGRWAYHNRQAEIDFGYRAIHETARVTKEIISNFYGAGPEYSYFQGCSTGGRQALMEAQRYPDDFDGILAGCPAYQYTKLQIYFINLALANYGSDGHDVLTTESIKILSDNVMRTCDDLDGLKDGLLSNPDSCQFNVSNLICNSEKQENCLTEEQVAAVKRIYSPPEDSQDNKLSDIAAPFGSETSWSWITGITPDPMDGALATTAEQFIRYMAYQDDPGEAFEITDFNFDKHPSQMEYMSHIYNVDNPRLDAFSKRGGKLLVWHGWADVAVPPIESIQYYKSVESLIGDRNLTQEFFRLFIIPGMDHCGIGDGPGIDQHGFDPLTALELWVEQGQAPESLLTTKTDEEDNVVWTRPACPYPQKTVYDGEGDPDEASSFECINPD